MNRLSHSLSRNVIAIATIAIIALGSSTAFALTANTANGISYLTGGVTLDERQEMTDQRKNFSLQLKFAAKSGRYLGDVSVNITDATGAAVFESTSDGPWLWVNLPAGSYTLKATSGGVGQSQKISIGKNAPRELTMYWNVIEKDDAKE
jgi:hypothetical protein